MIAGRTIQQSRSVKLEISIETPLVIIRSHERNFYICKSAECLQLDDLRDFYLHVSFVFCCFHPPQTMPVLFLTFNTAESLQRENESVHKAEVNNQHQHTISFSFLSRLLVTAPASLHGIEKNRIFLKSTAVDQKN